MKRLMDIYSRILSFVSTRPRRQWKERKKNKGQGHQKSIDGQALAVRLNLTTLPRRTVLPSKKIIHVAILSRQNRMIMKQNLIRFEP